MIGPEVEIFLCSYLEALQDIPDQLQTEISSYLQSDIQHQHRLQMCMQYIQRLRNSTCTTERNLLVKKLCQDLVTIQDICDKRSAILDEMGQLMETQTQKLYDLCAKSRAVPSQSGTSETENNDESEMDATDTDRTDEVDRVVACEGQKKSPDDDEELDGSHPHRLRPSNRRSVNQWRMNGQQDCKNGPPTVAKAKNTFRSIKQSSMRNEHTDDRIPTEQRHQKLIGNYPRYARAHQQKQNRLKKQQQQRSISMGIHTNRSRNIPFPDPSRRRAAMSKSNVGPYYLKTGRRLDAKVSRAGWSSVKRCYYHEEQKVSPVSNMSIDEPKTEASTSHRNTLGITPRTRDATPDRTWPNSESQSPDELDGSENMEENAADEGASLHMREVKPYYGKGQRSRITAASAVAGNRFYHTNARRLSRISKPMENSPKGGRSQLNRIDSPAQGPGKIVHRRTISRSSFTHGSQLDNERRDRNLPHFRRESRFAIHPPSNPSIRRPSPVQPSASPRPRSCFVSTGQSSCGNRSDASDDTAPDEKLYCLCKKVSYGDMIACDNKHCKVEWFHFTCVEIRVQPKGKWYCPLCRGESSKFKRPDA